MDSQSLPGRAIKFVKDVFSSWGREPRRASPAHSDKKLYLYLPVHEEMVFVGILSQEGKEFVFTYDPQFAQREDLPPISAFPIKEQPYRSETLWPFFEIRLPPLDRVDVAERIAAKKINPEDVLALLTEFGQKTLTTPYEFRAKRLSSTEMHRVGT